MRSCSTLIAIFPIGSYLFNGGIGFNHRFLFIIAFYLCIVLAVMLPKLFELEEREKKKLCISILIYLAFYAVISVWSDKKCRLCDGIFTVVYNFYIVWKTCKNAMGLSNDLCGNSRFFRTLFMNHRRKM